MPALRPALSPRCSGNETSSRRAAPRPRRLPGQSPSLTTITSASAARACGTTDARVTSRYAGADQVGIRMEAVGVAGTLGIVPGSRPAPHLHSRPPMGSEPYDAHNLLDRLSRRSTLEHYYAHMQERERLLVDRRLGITRRRGPVGRLGLAPRPAPVPGARSSGSSGWTPIPRGSRACFETGRADEALVGLAGELDLPDASFDVVLYRLVLHHLAFQGPLDPVFSEARRLLRPGGAMVAIEPGLWHPVGLALAAANRLGAATAIHGTPDDIPLSPSRLTAAARAGRTRPRAPRRDLRLAAPAPRDPGRARPDRRARVAPARRAVRPHADADRPWPLRR